MAGLETCTGCGRKLAPEAVKSAGGKPLCPPCYERAKAIVEERRKRAAEEKKVAAVKAKQEATRASQVRDAGGEAGPAFATGGASDPVIIPPSGLRSAASSRGDAEVQGLLGSAGTICILARIAAIIMLVGALLSITLGVMGWLNSPPVAGAAGIILLVVGSLFALVWLVLPAALLWFLGGWVKEFSRLFAGHLNA